jgi:hypothetical protein
MSWTDRTAHLLPQVRTRVLDGRPLIAESSRGVEDKRGCLIVGTAAELATLDAEVAQALLPETSVWSEASPAYKPRFP